MPYCASGFDYLSELISPAQEQALLEEVRRLPFAEARYKEYRAKRRVVMFEAEGEIAPFLRPLRDKVAAWLAMASEEFAHALVAEYRPGAGVGWHRDMPDFALIAGVSLGGSARMRFRPYQASNRAAQKALAIELEPRSVYVLRNNVRWHWQHQIAPTRELRYSVTFRTLMKR